VDGTENGKRKSSAAGDGSEVDSDLKAVASEYKSSLSTWIGFGVWRKYLICERDASEAKGGA